jgi:hypothetical protein
MRVGTFAICAAILAACGGGEQTVVVAKFKRVTGPDGTRNWYTVRCESLTDCYELAGRACPGGYAVADNAGTESTESTSAASATRVGGVVVAGGQGSSRTKRGGEMLIHCKAPGAPAPATQLHSYA